MKETIYTIPINDAFDSDCCCPMCYIQSKLTNERVEAAVGAAMMEPEHREISNEKGFCKKHIHMVYAQQKALPLALVLQSYIDVQNNKIFKMIGEQPIKKGLFKSNHSKKQTALNVISYIAEQQNKCSICDEVNKQMQRYAENTVDMWKAINEFKEKFNNNCDFCLEHFKLLLETAEKRLNDKNFDEFYNTITKAQQQSLAELYNDITEFVNSFDYRNSGKLSENARAATVTAVKKFIGEEL